MPRLAVAALPLLIATALATAPAAAQTAPPAPATASVVMRLEVDASDLSRRVLHARQRIAVRAGALTLLYPQWIQGNHSPTGPIDKLAGLRIRGNGQAIAWQRDPLNVYAFKLVVPEGVSELELSFDVLTPTAGNQGRVVMTPDVLNLQWNQVALYPAGIPAPSIEVASSLTLPAGWQAGTVLELEARDGDRLRYRPVPLHTLLDSPVFAGRHYKQFDLAPGAKIPVRLNVVADAAKYLEAKPEQLKPHRELVTQAGRLFGSQPYDRYDFLLSLSGQLSGIGLEHHRSSENGVDADYFTGWDGGSATGRDLLAHEFVHAWNGKYRRPTGLVADNFNQPLNDELLWVYEGQTQYWGYVLAARSGLWKPEFARDALAQVVARYAHDRPGLAWRTLQDTTYDPVIAQRRAKPYGSYQLSEDYYSGGQLVWLAVDAKLRELSGDKRSLDDFARGFFGVNDGEWKVQNTYTFEDVVATLNGVHPHDWATFLRDRLDGKTGLAGGIEASGWKLVFKDEPNAYAKGAGSRGGADFTYSIGLSVGKDGSIGDVRWDGPAFNAGIGSGTQVVAVNGMAYDADVLEEAIKAATNSKAPIELLVKEFDRYRTVKLDYHGGLRHPHLVRIEGKPDYLTPILSARK